MFGFFQKPRKALVEPLVIPSVVQMVPVRRSAFDASSDNAHDLVADVALFVTKMQEETASFGGEIPRLALQSYRANQYLTSGSHRNFVEQCGNHYAAIAMDTLAGLRAMGAFGHAELLEDLLALVPPQDFSREVSGLDEEFSILDDDLEDLERSRPMTAKNAEWIRGWLILQVLDDADYAVAIRERLCVNPIPTMVEAEDEFPEFNEAQKQFAMMRAAAGDTVPNERL